MRMRTIVLGISLAFLSAPVLALSLVDAFNLAVQADTRLLAARQNRDASDQEIAIGRAVLLPAVSAGARMTRSTGDSDLVRENFLGIPVSQNDVIDQVNSSATLSVRQPLFDLQRWAYYEQGKVRAQYGQTQYTAELQELYFRVVESYFNVLKAEHEIALTAAQQAAIEQLARQTRRLFDAGEGTITDIEEAQARLDLILAQKIELEAMLQASSRSLGNLLGRTPDGLLPVSVNIPEQPVLPAAQDLTYWQAQAEAGNPVLAIRADAVKLAKTDLQRQSAAYYPTVSLAAQLSKSKSDDRRSSENSLSKTIALLVDVPIFEGGATLANVRKSTALLDKSETEYQGSRLQLNRDVELSYLGVNSGWQKCRALLSAVRSNEKALLSAEKGFQAGTRSTIDILDAQQRVFTAKRDLLNTKLVMLLNLAKLKVHAGAMGVNDLRQLELLLQ